MRPLQSFSSLREIRKELYEVFVWSETYDGSLMKFLCNQRLTMGALQSFCSIEDLRWELDEVFAQSEAFDERFSKFLFSQRCTMRALQSFSWNASNR